MLPYNHPFVQSPLQDRIAQEIKMTIIAAEGTSAIHFGSASALHRPHYTSVAGGLPEFACAL